MKNSITLALILCILLYGCASKVEITDVSFGKSATRAGQKLNQEETEAFSSIYSSLYRNYFYKMTEKDSANGNIGGLGVDFAFRQNGKEETITIIIPFGGWVEYHGNKLFVSSYHEIYDFFRELLVKYPNACGFTMDDLVMNFQVLGESTLEDIFCVNKNGVIIADHAEGVVLANGWHTVSSVYKTAGNESSTDNTTLDKLFLERTKGIYSINTVIYDDGMSIKLIGESNDLRVYAVSKVEY